MVVKIKFLAIIILILMIFQTGESIKFSTGGEANININGIPNHVHVPDEIEINNNVRLFDINETIDSIDNESWSTWKNFYINKTA